MVCDVTLNGHYFCVGSVLGDPLVSLSVVVSTGSVSVLVSVSELKFSVSLSVVVSTGVSPTGVSATGSAGVSPTVGGFTSLFPGT